MNSTSSFDAVLFDLDGVLTSTAAIHATAWKRTFDALLAPWGQEPFDLERDYLDHVDGKPRSAGVRDFLGSSGIRLDDASIQTIAARKQSHFERALDHSGVEAFPGSVRWAVDMQPAGTTYRLIEGRGLPIRHFGEPLRLTPDAPPHRPATPTRQLPHAA